MSSVVLRHVEVRTWPERPDVLVIDQDRAVALAHFRLDDIPPGAEGDPVFDLSRPFEERAASALRHVESDQEVLKLHFEADPQFSVHLACTPEPRASLDLLLGEYGLSLDAVEIGQPAMLLRRLNELSDEALWSLLADWYDRAERRYPPGTSRQEPGSWVHRAHPDRADHFTSMAGGDRDLAAEIFREMIDVAPGDLRLYPLLQWVFFSRTEFADLKIGPPPAFSALLGISGQADPAPAAGSA
ncbi:hypothetical protein [Miltoncostaea oceani]|uniref:hypothetical protein n=1 Tax=Miltoncostaea oceani TaxID=2843216 RepID=UPI001C3DAF1E|nr:hypothetical protein [Miltoncostaea oceani]